MSSDLLDTILNAGYDVISLGLITLVTRNIDGNSVNIAYYGKYVCGVPTLMLNNNIELLKQFIIDVDIAKYCYDLCYISGRIDCKLYPFNISGNQIGDDDMVISVFHDTITGQRCLIYDTTEIVHASRSIKHMCHYFNSDYVGGISYPYLLVINEDDIHKLSDYRDNNLYFLHVISQSVTSIGKIINEVKSTRCPNLEGVYVFDAQKCQVTYCGLGEYDLPELSLSGDDYRYAVDYTRIAEKIEKLYIK